MPHHHAPICVLGMHRSGTSSIAAALQGLGVYLGPEPHLMKRRADNPEGFFEHQLLTDLNDEILWRLGGCWYDPPPLLAGWEASPVLQEIRERAEDILRQDFGTARLWGWKDPRNCLTLSFWQPLLPPLRFVLCLRNPIDVARSLQLRDGLPLEKGIDLWMRHMTEAVGRVAGSATHLVAYDDFVDQPDTELERLAAFVGGMTPGADESKARARKIVDVSLRHHKTALCDLFASSDASHAASAFYSALKALSALQRAGALHGEELESLGSLLGRYSYRAHTDERMARRLPGRVADLSQALSTRSAERDDLERELQATREAASASLAAEQAARLGAQQDAECQRAEAAQLQAQLAAVRGAAEDDRTRLTGEIGRLNALLQHLQTPTGALRLVVRTMLPSAAHNAVRRAAQLLPGWFQR